MATVHSLHGDSKSSSSTSFDDDEAPFDTGGGNGGPTVDQHTRDYIDSKTEATRSENDKRFTEMVSKIDTSFSQLSGKMVTRNDMIVAALALAALIVAMFAFGGDRFDGGFAASSATSKDIATLTEANKATIIALSDLAELQKENAESTKALLAVHQNHVSKADD